MVVVAPQAAAAAAAATVATGDTVNHLASVVHVKQSCTVQCADAGDVENLICVICFEMSKTSKSDIFVYVLACREWQYAPAHIPVFLFILCVRLFPARAILLLPLPAFGCRWWPGRRR